EVWANAERAAHSRELLDAVASLRSDTRKAQAAQRAFLISGVDDRLVPYNEAAAGMRAAAAQLPTLADGDEDQAARARDVGQQLESGIKSLNDIIEQRRKPGGLEEIRKRAKAMSHSFLDPLLATLDEMGSAERDRLASRDLAASRAYTWARISGAASAAVGLIALGLFAWVLRRSALA